MIIMAETDVTQTEKKKGNFILPLINTVIFPKTRTKVLVDKDTGDNLLREMSHIDSAYPIGLTIKSDADPSKISEETLYKSGNLLDITLIHQAEDGYMVGVQAISRVQIDTIFTDEGRFYATYNSVSDIQDIDDIGHFELMGEIKKTLHEISNNFQGSDQFTVPVDQMESIDQIIGFTMPYIPISLEIKQMLLETLSLQQRYLVFLEILIEFRESINIRIEMTRKVAEKVTKCNREAMLREQLKVIQDELSELDGSGSGEGGYRERVQQSKMPEEVKKKAFAEVKKLEAGGSQNHESPVIRNYLDLLLELPWITEEKKSINIAETRSILEKNHFGLEKVKERIIQHLAVMKLKNDKQGSILLFTGPPGTGKTSLGKSIADALGREYVRVSLGGVKDEAEIRGHRRTYVGAMPGRVIQGIKRAGTKNPVFVLDEIDKLSSSYSGDPASALLEVLDPEQNNSFSDHYLEVPYDLSDVLFIATANSVGTIPVPLLDRMEMIEISSYTKHEMFAIGKEHLLPKTLEEHGLDEEKLKVEDDAFLLIIEKYTREAGVRGLKKQLNRIARYVSEKIVAGKGDLPYVVTADMLTEILGKEVFRHEIAKKKPAPGVVTGLAWTPVGGEILFIEGTFMPGSGKLTLTGQLGDVMKESANISMSLIRSRFAHTANSIDFKTSDVHIHVPSGATPKDGPSAGVTLFTALVSLITGKTADPKLAMTGEITLSGAVLPVGGIKEKILAAHRAGITKIIMPKENATDLDEIPEDVRNDLTFVLVETIEEVLQEALVLDLPCPIIYNMGNQLVPAPSF
jgi:ATP-dependent Lon protease